MTRAEILWLLNYLSAAYRSFTVDRDEAEGVVNVWMDILQGVNFEAAQDAVRRLCRENTAFAPTPGEIYQACMSKGTKLSIYDIQELERQQEQLLLQEYHETNEVIPMPDHIHKLLERLEKKRTLGGDDTLE